MQKTGQEIVDEALAGVEGTGVPTAEQETVGRVDAPDEETAEADGEGTDTNA